ncbi:MAG: hypothetical protein ACI9NC_000827 [Verrucomicrobiales bacterium]|jgi:hypothetical protein
MRIGEEIRCEFKQDGLVVGIAGFNDWCGTAEAWMNGALG